MNRFDENENDLTELGTASIETKGPPVPVDIDNQGSLGGAGLSDE